MESWTRRDFLRLTAACGVLAAGGSWMSACGSDASGSVLAQAKKAGVIKVGIAGEVPYGYKPDGRVTGEAPEVARAVLAKLGVKDITAVEVEFNSLIPALIGKQFDIVTAGMNITPARCQQVAFSVPDYVAPTALLVPKGNPKQLASFEDVKNKGLTVAVFREAVEQGFAADAGIPTDRVHTFSSQDAQDALLRAVESGRSDCAALSNISLNALVSQYSDAAVEVTKGFFAKKNGREVISAGGFVFRKEDTDFVASFDRELTQLHKSGEWLKVVQPFGFNQDNLPVDLTTEQLCRP